MKIRFGFVANALGLWDSSPSKTMTFARWGQLSKEERHEKLITITRNNLANTLRALHYNIAHQFPLHRFSSSIVPLATHPDVNWDYLSPFKEQFKEIGRLVQKNQLRISFHPNQFTLFTSKDDKITKNAVTDMSYHYNVLEAMGLSETGILNIHVGGAYGNKDEAVKRFHENIKQLPLEIKQQMTLENDDKTYTAEETLAICQKEKIPLVFDYHHHLANPSEKPLEDLLPDIFSTWNHTHFIPKVHLSSPKSNDQYRSHHDFVELDYVLPFLKLTKELQQDFDVMIEAKQKDLALIKLLYELSKVRGFQRIAGGIIKLK
ncbi:UV DNA damage repair endonuclease UvsE [Anaerobacillus sp. MEB173]|uniref:UV DNA damage repair endonuclease UvsE n=1 Tax=Anaerobacillus sp. MEB173 TaxID=3383345 RepID=UPI003F8FF329